MANEIDALSLSITANTTQAKENINKLIDSLKNLDTRFRSLSGSTIYANNLETAVHSITRINNAISNIDDSKLKSVASALKSLGTAGNNLANFGNVSQAGKAMDTVSAKAQNMAKSLAESFHIKDKDAIDSLTSSIKTMITTMGKGDAFYAAEANVQKVIEDFGLFENKLHDVESTYEKVRQVIRSQPLYVPENYSSDANWLSNLATIGIKNTTHDMSAGVLAGQLASQLESLVPALQGVANESDIINVLADYLRNNATPAMIGFNEAFMQGDDAWFLMDDAIRQTEQSLGIIVPSLQELEQHMRQFGGDDATIQSWRDSMQSVSTVVQQMNDEMAKMQQSSEPFDRIVQGLEQLDGVTIGDFSNITVLAEGVNKLGYQSAVTASQTLPLIADGLRQFEGFDLPDLGDMDNFSRGLRSLGSRAVQNAANALPFVADGLKQLKNVGDLPHMDGLNEFAKALSIFGRQTSTTAVQTIPQLTQAFQKLFETMSKAPKISQNTIDAANAMANLANKTGGVTRALNGANPSLNLWSKNAGRATKSTFSLASAIGKVYATYWMLFRAFGMIGKAINIASDLTEVKNVVVQAFGDMAYKATEFADTAGEAFGMSKLQALDAASRYQAMGKTMGITDRAVAKSNDFLREKLSDTLALEKVQQGYSDLGNTAADMSINLTKLAGDLASLYNTDIDVAAEKLNSIFTGTTKPLREFGFDLTQATLQEWALKNGIDANVKSMTQAQKAVLRYQYVMANASFVMGDFARTSESWHNSIVRLKLAFQNLGSVVGQGFINLLKPAVQKITAFVNTLTGLVQKALNAIGKLLGWQLQIDPVKPLGDGVGGSGDSGMDDMEDAANGAGKGAEETADAMDDADQAAEGTADNLDKAQKAAKKMKDYLLGIDELNVFQPEQDTDTTDKDKTKKDKTKKDKDNKDKSGSGSGGKSGGGASEGGATGGDVSFIPYESDINSWWELGNRIAETIGKALWNIPWDSIQSSAQQFAKNLGDFLNGFIDSDIFWTGIGHTIAEALNTALIFAETLLDTVKWGKLGTQVGNMIMQAVNDFEWDRLGRTIAKGINAAADFVFNLGKTLDFKVIGEKIAESINNFFREWDSRKIADALNVWVDNLWDLIVSTLSNIEWKEIWKDVTGFFDEIELDTLAVIIGAIAWKWAGASVINLAKAALKKKVLEIIATVSIKDVIVYLTGFSLQWMGTPTFDALIAPLVEKFDVEFSKAFPRFSEIIGRTLAGAIGGAMTGIVIGALGGPIGMLAGAIIGGIVGALTDDALRNALVENVFNFDLALGLANSAIEHFKNAWHTVCSNGDLFEAGKDIVLGIGEGIAGALAFLVEPIADLFAWIWDGICNIFGISSPAKKMKPIGENILLGIIEGFKGKWGDFTNAISDWFNNNVKPWFTLDRWKSIANNIREAITSKWNETKNLWITNISNWWNSNVVPWLTIDRWKAEADHIREAIITKFGEMVRQWITDITNWWNTHVVPWLDLNRWKTEADHIRDAIISKFDEMVTSWATKISNWWNTYVVKYFDINEWKKLAKNIYDAVIGAIDDVIRDWGKKIEELVKEFEKYFTADAFAKIGKEAIDGLLKGFSEAWGAITTWATEKAEWLKNIFKIKPEIDTSDINTSTNTQTSSDTKKDKDKNKSNKASKKASGGVFDDGRWRNVHAYASGGIPDEGQLFWAREQGAELVGQIGGNTAVMNNDQIVASVASGVQQAVTEALAPYLSDISQNTRVTANKDFTVQIGDRQIAEANTRGQRQLGAVLFT